MEPWQKALDKFQEGKNIFITGGAGVGKSYTLRKIIDWAEDNEKECARTALTGMASLQMQLGQTLHSCLGLGIKTKRDQAREVISSYKFQTEIKWQLRVLDVLIIDEISMLRSDLIELIDEILRQTLDPEKPFGGLQVIFSGDFMQLPPVVRRDDHLPRFWAFQSEVWQDLELEIIYLTEIKRQDDPTFARALNAIRAGAVSPNIEQYFNATMLHDFGQDIEPVKLLSTNAQVDQWNRKRLNLVDDKEYIFDAEIWAENEFLEKKIKKECIAMEKLELRIGCQVMILKNSGDGQYVNGSMGELMAIKDRTDEKGIAEKCLFVELFDSGNMVVLKQEEWKIEKQLEERDRFGKKKIAKLASFKQFPVKLGYAITIHKSQGMSIDFLEVDLMRCFAPGMAYVALSRARTYEGLRVLNFNRGAVRVDPAAFNYYMNLKNEGVI